MELLSPLMVVLLFCQLSTRVDAEQDKNDFARRHRVKHGLYRDGRLPAVPGVCRTYYHSDVETYDSFSYTFVDEGVFKLMDNIYDNVFVQVKNFLDGSSSPHCAVAVKSVPARPGETLILDMCDADVITAYKCQTNQTYPISKDGTEYTIQTHNEATIIAKENGHCIILTVEHPAAYEGSTWGLCGNHDGNPDNDFEIIPGDGNTNMDTFLEAARIGPDDPNYFEECTYMPAMVIEV